MLLTAAMLVSVLGASELSRDVIIEEARTYKVEAIGEIVLNEHGIIIADLIEEYADNPSIVEMLENFMAYTLPEPVCLDTQSNLEIIEREYSDYVVPEYDIIEEVADVMCAPTELAEFVTEEAPSFVGERFESALGNPISTMSTTTDGVCCCMEWAFQVTGTGASRVETIIGNVSRNSILEVPNRVTPHSSLTSFFGTVPINVTRVGNGNVMTIPPTVNAIAIPNSVTHIGNNAFNGRTNIRIVTLGSGVTNIGSSAFRNTRITAIVIPASVTRLEANAFSHNSSLATVRFLRTTAPPTNFFGTNAFQSVSSSLQIQVHYGRVAAYRSNSSSQLANRRFESFCALNHGRRCTCQLKRGDVDNSGRITIGNNTGDAYQIFRYLAKLTGSIATFNASGVATSYNQNALDASLITAASRTRGTPNALDANEIQAFGIGMTGILSGRYDFGF